METASNTGELCHRTVGEVVAEDYRRADVFKAFGIDYCCGGDRTVSEACSARGVACDEVMEALEAAEQAPIASGRAADMPDVRNWPPDFLASYIVNVHHRYVREHAPRLLELTQTVARVHGKTNPEAVQIANLFAELATELEEHTGKEEGILFPYISATFAASRGEAPPPDPTTVDQDSWVEALEDEHDNAGAILRTIRTLSRNFVLPETACNTYRMAYAGLEAFEADLHRHIHLENNVLFPVAARLRGELSIQSPRVLSSGSQTG